MELFAKIEKQTKENREIMDSSEFRLTSNEIHENILRIPKK